MDAALPPAELCPDLTRRPLLERFRIARPAIVSIVAPAGFGKSTLMRQLGASAAAFAVCDCAGVESALDLAAAVVGALAEENPGRGPRLAATAGFVAVSGAAASDRIDAVVSAWEEGAGDAAFAFENAEHVLAESGARDLLARLLARRPHGRSVILCSREAPRLHLSRFAPPHRILSVRAGDLAFTPAEIASIFAGLGCGDEVLGRIVDLSAGWPIAVLLLARFAAEQRLEPLIERLDDIAFEELHEYLADQVLDDAPPVAIEGMLAAAAIPNATDDDLALALGDARLVAAFREWESGSPFVARSDDGVCLVHPLVAVTLLERHPARADALLAGTAQSWLDAGAYRRAAEIALGRGDQVGAAHALERLVPVDGEAPSIAYAAVLFALDPDVVLRYPRLWSTIALLRTFAVDVRAQLAESEQLGARSSAGIAPSLRLSLSMLRVLMLGYAGDHDGALALIDELRSAIAAPEGPSSRLHGWLAYLRAMSSARLGHLAGAERDIAAARPFLHDVHLGAAGLDLAAAEIARARGERAAEREHHARALTAVRATQLGNFVALHEAEATLGAWLAGDDAATEEHLRALETEIAREGVRAFAFFAAGLRRAQCEPASTGHAKWTAWGHLVAAAHAETGATAIAHANAAREAALAYGAPFELVLTAIARAELDPARRGGEHAEAVAAAKRIDSPALRAAVEGLRGRRGGGFLEAFAARYRRTRTRPGGELRVELVSGRVLRDGETINLADREHALFVAVALRRDPLSRDRLTEMLWPALSERAARNAFHVCLHRLKARLEDDDAIVRTGDGYRLGDRVAVDLREIDQLAAAVRARRGSDDAANVHALYARLRVERPPRFAAWEWFEPTERRLCELRADVTRLVALRALEESRWEDALALSSEMIAYDPCDEPAQEIAIRAHLGAGDGAAARRQFRQYRATLRDELGCDPSPNLTALLEDEPVSPPRGR